MQPVKRIVTPSFFFQAILALILFLFISCSQKKLESKPSGLLSKDKMTDVLVDIHLAEGAADNRKLKSGQIDLMMTTRYKELFQKHEITYEEFKVSYDYYMNHAEELAEIYTEVVNKLTTRESLINRDKNVKPPPVQQKDSFYIREGRDTL